MSKGDLRQGASMWILPVEIWSYLLMSMPQIQFGGKGTITLLSIEILDPLDMVSIHLCQLVEADGLERGKSHVWNDAFESQCRASRLFVGTLNIKIYSQMYQVHILYLLYVTTTLQFRITKYLAKWYEHFSICFRFAAQGHVHIYPSTNCLDCQKSRICLSLAKRCAKINSHSMHHFNTLRPRLNGHLFADNSCKCICYKKLHFFWIKFPLYLGAKVHHVKLWWHWKVYHGAFLDTVCVVSMVTYSQSY